MLQADMLGKLTYAAFAVDKTAKDQQTLFAGVNMVQASVTGFCPAAMAFKALGIKPGSSFR